MTTVLRKLLDELMGPNRNGDRADAIITDFRDPRVCKHYLLGLCPHDLFTNTKEDLGVCDLVHDDRLKRAYETAALTYDFKYEGELERRLEKLIADAERRIQKGRERVADEEGVSDGFIPRIDVDSAPELADVSASIDTAQLEAEAAKEAGDVEKAAKLAEDIEGLVRRKAEMQARLLLSKASDDDKRASATNRQRLRVCDVCGAFLSLNDSDERIADHFGGRVHLGYLAIRQKLKNLREWRAAMRATAPAPAPSGGHMSAGPSTAASGAYASDRGDYRGSRYDASGPRSYDRGYDRDRGGGGGYDRGYDRGHDRGYDRGGCSRQDDRGGYNRGGGGYDRDRNRDSGRYDSRGGGRDDYRRDDYRDRDSGRRDSYRDRY